MDSTELRLRTGTTLVTDITAEVRSYCEGRGDGLVHVFVPHATAGAALMETGSGSEDDLASALARVVPRDAAYAHRHGSRGHGGDHVVPAVVSPSLAVPVLGGRPTLGTWQRVVVVDPNVDNPERRVRLSFLAG